MSANSSIENKSWFLATLTMGTLALVIFLVQHFVTQIFDIAVEISIFYVPATLLVAFYYLRRRLSKSSH